MLTHLMVLACRWAHSSSAAAATISHDVQRRNCGLRLIMLLLQKSSGFFLTSAASVYLLRSLLFPALVHCLTQAHLSSIASSHTADPQSDGVDVELSFSLALSIFVHVHEHMQAFMPAEIGILLQRTLLPLLQAKYTTHEQKMRILDTLVSRA
jgi:hypothetical protein